MQDFVLNAFIAKLYEFCQICFIRHANITRPNIFFSIVNI